MVTTLRSPLPTPGVPADATERGCYSISEAAALLGVTRVTVSRWIRGGRLLASRLGHRTVRIRHEDLERFLLQARPGAAGSWVGRQPRTGTADDRSEHVVRFYEMEASLLEGVAEFIGAGLRAGEAGIVVATASHREALEARLEAGGLALAAARACGRYVPLDAAETLASFMVDGAPDPARFAEVIGGVIGQATKGGRRPRVFGEMVALLAAAGNHLGTIRLEGLWNELQQAHDFSLFCAYPMDALAGESLAPLLGDVCAQHSRVIPAESYAALDDPDARLRAIVALQQKAASLEAEIADRQRAEGELCRSRRELEDFVENATEALHWVGPDGHILWANRAELELLGYAAEEYIGRPIADFHVDRDVIEDILRRLAAGEELRGYEARLRAKDGAIKHVLINSNVYWEDGRFVHTRCFTRDITDRKRAEREREALLAREREARRQAEAALRVRDEFLAIAAHELRTPLTSLSGQAQLALRRFERTGQLEPERAEGALRTIKAQSDKLSRLMSQLLDVSRLEAGKLALERRPTDMVALVEEAAAGARAWGDRDVIAVRVPAALEARVDPLRLEQVLTNLLDNAIKFSPDGGAIEVALCRSGPDALEIAVRDHGLGIPPETRGRIFERFSQAHANGHRGGMGLGLYVSRQIAELHGGEIRAEFPADGGTRMVVRLPIGADEPATSRVGPRPGEGLAGVGRNALPQFSPV